MPTIWNDPFARTFRDLLTGLRQTRTRYCIIGALAVSVWGSSRATQDIDCLVLLDEGRPAALVKLDAADPIADARSLLGDEHALNVRTLGQPRQDGAELPWKTWMDKEDLHGARTPTARSGTRWSRS